MSAPAQRLERILRLESDQRQAVMKRCGLSEAALLHISEMLAQIADVEISDLRDTAVDRDGNGLVGTPEWSAYMNTTDILDNARHMSHELARMARQLQDAEVSA